MMKKEKKHGSVTTYSGDSFIRAPCIFALNDRRQEYCLLLHTHTIYTAIQSCIASKDSVPLCQGVRGHAHPYAYLSHSHNQDQA